ncbi:MAG: elongation factor P [Rubrivivax sp.]|nr:elongation factor P [Rubrivivax sp.]
MAIDTSDFRNGLTIVQDGEVYQIVEFQHVKPGKGGAFVRTKLRHYSTGKVKDQTFRAGEKMEQAVLERRSLQFLYRAGDQLAFMDMESFEQIEINEELLGDQAKWMVDGLEVTFVYWHDQVIGVDIPAAIVAEVVQTDPGVRGDTAQGGSKPATLSSGAVVSVPLFINEGEQIKVDTRSGAYLERVKA